MLAACPLPATAQSSRGTGLFDDLVPGSPGNLAAQCAADLRRLRIFDRAPLTRCIVNQKRTEIAARADPAMMRLWEVHFARLIEIADRYDRGRLTEAQYDLELARAHKQFDDESEALFAARNAEIDGRYRARLEDIERRYPSPPPVVWQQPTPSAPAKPPPASTAPAWPGLPRLGTDCYTTPGSLGRSVSCW
jgi:hypothetical protein